MRRWITVAATAAILVALDTGVIRMALDSKKAPENVVVAPAKASSVPTVVRVARTPEAARSHARLQLQALGWKHPQWVCLSKLWQHESSWRPSALNKVKVNGRHAGGIPQILGLDPSSTVEHQIQRGFEYIKHRYGTPCTAWKHWKAKADYYNGDWHGGSY